MSFACECGKAYSTQTNRNKHRNKHYPRCLEGVNLRPSTGTGGKIQCPCCDAWLVAASLMKDHVKKRHPDAYAAAQLAFQVEMAALQTNTACPLCPKVCETREQLHGHVVGAHGDSGVKITLSAGGRPTSDTKYIPDAFRLAKTIIANADANPAGVALLANAAASDAASDAAAVRREQQRAAAARIRPAGGPPKDAVASDAARRAEKRAAWAGLDEFDRDAVSVFLKTRPPVDEKSVCKRVCKLFVSPSASNKGLHLQPQCGSSGALQPIDHVPVGHTPCRRCFDIIGTPVTSALAERAAAPRASRRAKDGADPLDPAFGLARDVVLRRPDEDVDARYVFVDGAARAWRSIELERAKNSRRDAQPERKAYKKRMREEDPDHIRDQQKRSRDKHRDEINARNRDKYANDDDWREKRLADKRSAYQARVEHYRVKNREKHERCRQQRNVYSRDYCTTWRASEAGRAWRLRYLGSVQRTVDALKVSAETRGLDIEITDVDIGAMLGSACYFCAWDPADEAAVEDATSAATAASSSIESSVASAIDLRATDRSNMGVLCGVEACQTMGIDRRDANLGYTRANAVPCCTPCNMAKGDMPERDYVQRSVNIAVHNNSADPDVRAADLAHKTKHRFARGELVGSDHADHIKHAKKRQIDSELDKQAYDEVRANPCFFCGRHPPLDGPSTMTVDRLDSSKGYVAENVVAACHGCNMMKRQDSVDAFVERCTKVALHLHAYLDEIKVGEAMRVDRATAVEGAEMRAAVHARKQEKRAKRGTADRLHDIATDAVDRTVPEDVAKPSDLVVVTTGVGTKVYHTHIDCTRIKNKDKVKTVHYTDTGNRLPCALCRNHARLEHYGRTQEIEAMMHRKHKLDEQESTRLKASTIMDGAKIRKSTNNMSSVAALLNINDVGVKKARTVMMMCRDNPSRVRAACCDLFETPEALDKFIADEAQALAAITERDRLQTAARRQAARGGVHPAKNLISAVAVSLGFGEERQKGRVVARHCAKNPDDVRAKASSVFENHEAMEEFIREETDKYNATLAKDLANKTKGK